MTYHVTTHESYLHWKEGTDLENVANVIRESFFNDERYTDHGLYAMIGEILGDVTINSSVPRLFYVEKDSLLSDEEDLLYLLAPFLEDGSLLRYRGEDGELFGWEIYDGKVIPQHAMIRWVDTEEDA